MHRRTLVWSGRLADTFFGFGLQTDRSCGRWLAEAASVSLSWPPMQRSFRVVCVACTEPWLSAQQRRAIPRKTKVDGGEH